MQRTTLITLDGKEYSVRYHSAFTRPDGVLQEERIEIVREYRVRVGVNKARPSYSYRRVAVSTSSKIGKKVLAEARARQGVKERLCTPVTIEQAGALYAGE